MYLQIPMPGDGFSLAIGRYRVAARIFIYLNYLTLAIARSNPGMAFVMVLSSTQNAMRK